MQADSLNQLLYEDEGSTLDFKRDQYPFSKATDEEKSELLKDILGFANCWRRADAFILIGVQEVQGGPSIVHGISDHLQDHSLQQFVNSLTNRPVQFGYETCEFEGKQVGIIRVELQRRPVFLKKDYGKLKRGEVYVRRGSSTDPSKPADPDEIALMGSGQLLIEREAVLAIEFAATDRERSFGEKLDWSAELCEMPNPEEIPRFDDAPAPIRWPDGHTIQIPNFSSFDSDNRLNHRFFHDLAEYTAFHKLFKMVRLVVTNNGEAPASDVRIEICIPHGSGFGIVDRSEVPDAPKQRTSIFASSAMKHLNLRPAFRHIGYVDIDKNDHETKVEIDCGILQPGRKVWTDSFFLGIGHSGDIQITGYLFSSNLSQPQPFSLSIAAEVKQSQMTVDELVSQSGASEDEE